MMHGRAGRSLIEMFIIIAILGVLISIAVPYFQGRIEASKIERAILELGQMGTAIDTHKAEFGTLPDTLAEVGWDKLDPWGRPYLYVNVEFKPPEVEMGNPRRNKHFKPINSQFDVFSLGRDGVSHPDVDKEESQDDVIRFDDGDWIGLGKDY